MDKKTGIIIGVLIASFVALIGVSIYQNGRSTIDYDQYDLGTVLDANEETGEIGEMIVGNPDAPVKIFEYGDYQCTACAPMNPYVKKLVEEYDGKVAVVFRTYILSYHNNGTAAASAALAAAAQGYWSEYKDLLFTNQNDWYYSDAATRQEQFEQYFEQVSKGKGDLEQFRTDMNSEAVKKKIEFDRGVYEKVTAADGEDDQWTPMFYIGGELIDQRSMSTDDFLKVLRDKIDAQLKG